MGLVTGVGSREGHGSLVAERAVRALVVVVLAVRLGKHFCFEQIAEECAPKQLVAQLSVEALDVRVLPGRAGINVTGLRTLLLR